MAVFKDDSGVDWAVDLNVTEIKRVRELAGVDLLDISGGKVFEKVLTDPIYLANTLFVLCEEQCKTREMSEEDFGKILKGDVWDRAAEALIQAVVDFSRNPKARAALGLVAGKYRELEARSSEIAIQQIQSPAMEKAMADGLERVRKEIEVAIGSGATSGGSPGSSE